MKTLKSLWWSVLALLLACSVLVTTACSDDDDDDDGPTDDRAVLAFADVTITKTSDTGAIEKGTDAFTASPKGSADLVVTITPSDDITYSLEGDGTTGESVIAALDATANNKLTITKAPAEAKSFTLVATPSAENETYKPIPLRITINITKFEKAAITAADIGVTSTTEGAWAAATKTVTVKLAQKTSGVKLTFTPATGVTYAIADTQATEGASVKGDDTKFSTDTGKENELTIAPAATNGTLAITVTPSESNADYTSAALNYVITIANTISAEELANAKAAYTAKVAELKAAKDASLTGVTVVTTVDTGADKHYNKAVGTSGNVDLAIPFKTGENPSKWIFKTDLKTYEDLLDKTAENVLTAATSATTDALKVTALESAETALDNAKKVLDTTDTINCKIKMLDAKWNADHFWSNNGASTIDQITGENGGKKVGANELTDSNAEGYAKSVKNASAKTSKQVTLAWLGYVAKDMASATDPTKIIDKNDHKTGYNVGVAEYDNRHGYINFYKTRSAVGYVTEVSSTGEVLRIKIEQTINDAIANIGNHLKDTEASWYTTAGANTTAWCSSADAPEGIGTTTDAIKGMMQYNVGIRLGGITETAAGKKTEVTSCTGIGANDKGDDNRIKFVRLADNSGKRITANVACGGKTNAADNKTYTTSTNAYDQTYVPFFDYGTKIPIIAGEKSVYRVTLQKDAGTQGSDGVEQGTGLIMDFVVNINAAATQPFADYQFRE